MDEPVFVFIVDQIDRLDVVMLFVPGTAFAPLENEP